MMLSELDDVTLVRGAETEGGFLPPTAYGTVVSVHNDGEAYTVEFEHPFHALLTIGPEALKPVSEATRERLLAAAE